MNLHSSTRNYIKERAYALEAFLYPHIHPQVEVCDWYTGFAGGIIFRLEDDREYLVATDKEADAILRVEIEQYISEAPLSVNLDRAAWADEETRQQVEAAQEARDVAAVQRILMKHIDGAVACEKLLGRAYMIAKYDSDEYTDGTFFFYRMG